MKTFIISLAISIFFLTSLNASPFDADLNLRLFNNQPIIVQFDHTGYSNPSQTFSINCVAPGRHRLAVWSAPTHFNNGFNSAPILLYNGFIDLYSASITSSVITFNRLVRIENVEPKFVEQVAYHHYDPNYTTNNFPTTNNYTCTPISISDVQFQQIKCSLANKNFDSTRLQLARQVVRTNPMNSKQISELMSVFSFESSRMDFAKFAYKYSIDPQNYYLLYDSFSFESSVSELSNFIDHHS